MQCDRFTQGPSKRKEGNAKGCWIYRTQLHHSVHVLEVDVFCVSHFILRSPGTIKTGTCTMKTFILICYWSPFPSVCVQHENTVVEGYMLPDNLSAHRPGVIFSGKRYYKLLAAG